MARNINQIADQQVLNFRDRAMAQSGRPGGSPAMRQLAVNSGATMAGPLGSGLGNVSGGIDDPAMYGLPPGAYGRPGPRDDMSSRVEGTSELPVMDEDDQNIVALAKSLLASGAAFDMPSALQMAREYAGEARAAASAQADAAVAAGDAKADARQSQRAMAQGVVPMEGETAADTQFRNRPMDQQEATLDFQQDSADNVTRGLRDGSVRQPGSQAWNEESAYDYAVDHGIDEAGDAQIVRDLARRLGREPRPEEVADEKKWRGWVNEEPGSERQARYNKAGWDEHYEANQRQFNDAERKKYGPPINTATIDPETGEWTKPVGFKDLPVDQQVARGARQAREKIARDRNAPQRLDALIVRSGLSDKEAQQVMAAGETDPELARGLKARLSREPSVEEIREEAIRRYGTRQRDRDLEFRTQRRLDAARLAGGSHMITGQGQGVMNRLMELPPEDRVRALLYSGPGGALAAQVDAQGLQNMMRMFNAEALAGADPFNRGLQNQALEQKRREQDPAWAGQQDIKAGRNTPQSEEEINRLANAADTTYGGFSFEDERRLVRDLMAIGMTQPQAEEIAYREAEERRYITGGAPGGRKPAAGPAAPPAPPVVPPRGDL